MKFSSSVVSAVTGGLLLTGCASSDPQFAFKDVQQRISQRSGGDVRWFREREATPEVETAVAALLKTNLTARAAVQIALLQNPRVQGIFEEIGISQAELVQASTLPNPEFSASWRFPEAGVGVLNQEYSAAGSFLDLVMLPLRKKVAARNLEATKLRVSHEVLTLAAEVQRTFYRAQASQQLLTRLKLIAEVNEAAADVAARQHRAGNITDLEFAEHQAVDAQSKVNAAKTQAEGRTEREQLNRLMGAWGKLTEWLLADELPPLPENESSMAHIESLAVKQRLDLEAGRSQLTQMSNALKLQKGFRYVPLAKVGANAERDTDGAWVVGPTLDLEIPLFNQGQGEIARLAAQYRQAQRAFEAQAIEIRSEARQARDQVIAHRDRADYYRKTLLPLRIRIVNESLLQYNAMQIGPIDLLRSKERELETEREYVEAWRDYWIARVDLEKAVGGRLSSSAEGSVQTEPKPPATTEHEHHHK